MKFFSKNTIFSLIFTSLYYFYNLYKNSIKEEDEIGEINCIKEEDEIEEINLEINEEIDDNNDYGWFVTGTNTPDNDIYK